MTVPSSVLSQVISLRSKRRLNVNVGNTNDRATASQLRATLWHCERCNVYISIHSPHTVDEASCPVCGDLPLELCGTFDSILGLRFADA
jgi:hypothetical protein